ncbi:MAG: hypothetical protein IT581_16345 [Verrucomicrobiales bacterium]|nr:hypothetical protein [Verrucomicrobiales bacterium]
MKWKFHGLVLFLVALNWIGTNSNAATYSFARDFLLAPNQSNKETDTWQFFYGVDLARRDGNYPRMTRLLKTVDSDLWLPANAEYPFIGKNNSTHVINGVQPTEGLVHPSNDGLGLAIAFQAPTNGLYDISGYIRPAHVGFASGIRWYLDEVNQAGALDSGVLVPTQNRNFSFRAMDLKAGERIYLIVQSNGDYRGDTTAIGFEVSPTTFSLELQILPVVMFAGTVGKNYQVQFLDSLSSVSNWQPFTNVVLTTPIVSVVDYGNRPLGQRFYRAVQME